MGSISFHVHGERARNATIASNVAVYVSSAFANNPAAEAAISNMRAIFTEEVAVSFAADWLTRTVDAGYLPGSVLCPQSSPIKASRSKRDSSSASTPHTGRDRSSSHSSTVSSASSLTDTTLVANETTPTRIRPGRPSPATQPAHTNARISTGQNTQYGTILPTTLTMLSTMTLSAPAIARTATGVADGPSSLSEDVRGFMVSIGRDRVVDYDVVWETYNYIGRALWETTVAAQLDLNSGTAKALVCLMTAM